MNMACWSTVLKEPKREAKVALLLECSLISLGYGEAEDYVPAKA